MYIIDLTVENFYFWHVSVFGCPAYENEKKTISFELVFKISAFKIVKFESENTLTST